MIRERVTVDDFEKIAKENEYFLWHFLMEDQHNTIMGLWSYFEDKIEPSNGEPVIHMVKTLLSMTDVPYYESYVKDSMDFLINLGLNGKNLHILRNPWPHLPPNKNFHYVPVVIGFKRKRMVRNTLQTCYCAEGITEIILELNPNLLNNIV
jgi:hypothetical protein